MRVTYREWNRWSIWYVIRNKLMWLLRLSKFKSALWAPRLEIGEPTVEFQSESSNLEISETQRCKWSLKLVSWTIPPCRGRPYFWHNSGFPDSMKPTHSMKNKLLYLKFTNLNVKLTQNTLHVNNGNHQASTLCQFTTHMYLLKPDLISMER